MRIALCLYGKQRDLHKCHQSWLHFIEAYNPDIFFHTWRDTVRSLLLRENAKSYLVSQDIDFSHLHPGITEYGSSAVNVLPQTYSIMQSDKLRTDYENLMEFKYDWVVRSRFDIALHTPTAIPFDTLDKANVYVCANHWPGQSEIYDDNIMIGSSDQMQMISGKLFEYTKAQIINHKIIPSGEQVLSSFMERRNNLIKKIDSLNFTLARNL